MQCHDVITHGQIVGHVKCGYHDRGGSPSMPYNADVDDTPIAPRFENGARVNWIDRVADRVINGTVLYTKGYCDCRIATIRPYRKRYTVEVNTFALDAGWVGTWDDSGKRRF